MKRSTSRRYVASTNVRKTSSVTRAPAFRMIFASPASRPSVASGSIRESMHVSRPRRRRARPSRPTLVKVFAYAALASRTSWKSSPGSDTGGMLGGLHASAWRQASSRLGNGLGPATGRKHATGEDQREAHDHPQGQLLVENRHAEHRRDRRVDVRDDGRSDRPDF